MREKSIFATCFLSLHGSCGKEGYQSECVSYVMDEESRPVGTRTLTSPVVTRQPYIFLGRRQHDVMPWEIAPMLEVRRFGD